MSSGSGSANDSSYSIPRRRRRAHGLVDEVINCVAGIQDDTTAEVTDTETVKVVVLKNKEKKAEFRNLALSV